MIPQDVVRAVREAALSAGDLSGNCDAALICAERGDAKHTAQELEWATSNLQAAIRDVARAREAIAKFAGAAA